MEVEKTVLALSDIERSTLKAIETHKKSFEEITKDAQIHIDSVRRALQWLEQKKLVELSHSKKSQIAIVLEELAERKMITKLQKAQTLDQLKKDSGFDEKELGFCIGKLKKLNILAIQAGKVELTEVGKEFLEKPLLEEQLISKIKNKNFDKEELSENELTALQELTRRGILKEKETINIEVSLTAEGEAAKKLLEKTNKRQYNIFDPVPEISIGKKHPYQSFLQDIRKKLVEIGFTEMPQRLVTQEFYNFDVLFQPQNHPARTWTDTYRLKNPRVGKLPDKKIVNAVKSSHENGGKSGSIGWRYKWSEQIAARLMPTAHGTSADARQMVEGVQVPGKYFVINRCYRPDVLDATHLVEFNQLDGFIIADDLSFPKLLGILKDFATEIAGATEVKFLPDYYPFTEPSTELAAKHPEVGWIEIGGAGIFRPEITLNLGIKEPVIAWGLGIDRLAMIKLKINDIRKLFSDDLRWLRESTLF